VPPSILRKEMLPKAAGDPHYFSRLGYEVLRAGGHLVVRQPPGERNALGRIKFMFPNDFSVYMHDTPMRKLFASSKRRSVMAACGSIIRSPCRNGSGPGWNEQRVKKLIGGKERYVYLPKPLPVHLEYFTAYVDESGELQLRADVYGYSRRVREALGLREIADLTKMFEGSASTGQLIFSILLISDRDVFWRILEMDAAVSMNVNLTPSLRSWSGKRSRRPLHIGKRSDPGALRLLEEQDRMQAAKLDQLRHDIQDGLESGRRRLGMPERSSKRRQKACARTAAAARNRCRAFRSDGHLILK